MKFILKMKVIGFSVLMVTSVSAWAGGVSGSPTDATVTCNGLNGSLSFDVIKANYKGELLTLKGQRGGRVRLTDAVFLDHLIDLELLRVKQWDQRRFLEGIGVDITKFSRHITTSNVIVSQNYNLDEISFLAPTLGGGTLDETYSSTYPLIGSFTEPERTNINEKRGVYLRLHIEQLSDRSYEVKVSKVIAGQKVCIQSALEKNPWFGLAGQNSDVPEFVEVCKEYKNISDQQESTLSSSKLTIKSCQLSE